MIVSSRVELARAVEHAERTASERPIEPGPQMSKELAERHQCARARNIRVRDQAARPMSASTCGVNLDPIPEGALRAPRRRIRMTVSYPLTKPGLPSQAEVEVSEVEIPQYGLGAILAVWAAAALPMAALAWLVAPALEDRFAGNGNVPLFKALNVCLTIGLVWQFVLVAVLVWREQRTFRWSTVREALWLRSPRSPRTGRTGGRVWLVVIPLIVATLIESMIPLGGPKGRDFGAFLGSDAGKAFMHGAWGWYALMLVWFVFNTVLGEELLFRGFLLPRMNGVFKRKDWLANGLLFAGYHLHVP
jgi:membrane protease YdiL (CAAX protease family)